MYKPTAENISRSEQVISGFLGYDHRLKINENAFYDESNMCSLYYPLAAARHKRGIFNIDGDGVHGLFAKDGLCFIKNSKLYYKGSEVAGLSFPGSEKKRQFVSMGTRLIIFPDKVYVDTARLDDYGSLDAEFKSGKGVNVGVTLCTRDGTEREFIPSREAPESPGNGTLWIDTSSESLAAFVYSGQEEMWSEASAVYVKISSPNIGKQFKEGDGVEINGLKEEALNGSKIIESVTADSITVIGIIKAAFTQTDEVTVARKLPDMDFVCENGNRLWGCSSKKNEIYASKLGDPKNFNCFEGLSTDSYAVSVGTDGEFTAAVSYRGYVMFFKEACLHRVYGSYPPFTVSALNIRGVQKGSELSVAVINESLYYKSPTDICRFDGGVPVSVSTVLGNEYYKDAVGGGVGDRYYICMTNRFGERSLFCYDEKSGIWHKEDDLNVKETACHNGNMYFLGESDGKYAIYLADGEVTYGNFFAVLGGYKTEEQVKWKLETGLWGLEMPGNKYYSDIELRFSGEKGTKISVSFSYNNNGEWQKKAELTAERTGSFTVPFITPRCDTMKIRIEGEGAFKLLSVTRIVERGSNLCMS